MPVDFTKMHGLGNDFIIVDNRHQNATLDSTLIQRLSARKTGIGCDQFIVLQPAKKAGADVFMHIYNADGSEVGACGNATRCVANILMEANKKDTVTIATDAGILKAIAAGRSRVTVDMGKPRLEWQDIPLAHAHDTLTLPLRSGPLNFPVGVSMGNPHAVFFVDDVDVIALENYGPDLEHDSLFPERANIGIAQIVDRSNVKLRVWERGVGETEACGTGACAAAVAAMRRGLTEQEVDVHLRGGTLHILWDKSGHVWMTGDVATSFTGTFNPEDYQ